VHRFTVEHLHGLLRGSCSGELSISGLRVEYRPRQGNHGFAAPFSAMKMKLNDDKIELLESGQAKTQVLKAPAAETKRIKELWDNLEKLGK